MSLRECFNAIEGHTEYKKTEFAALFEIARFGSFYNVFSKDQGKALRKARNPYTDKKQKKERPVMMDEVSGMLSALAKATNKKN